MMVDPALVEVELFDGSAKKKEAAKRTVGHFRVRDGRAIIELDQSEFSNPLTLTAIAVHELCHLRLQGEGRIRRGAPDGERLTDLLTVYFGFGIFTTNAAMSFARANRAWTIVSRGQLDDRALNGAARHDGYRRPGRSISTQARTFPWNKVWPTSNVQAELASFPRPIRCGAARDRTTADPCLEMM